MNATDLQDIIGSGESTTVQFKEKLTSPDAFAAEIAAMANTQGGMLLLGVTDTGEVRGLSSEELRAYGSQVADIATNRVIPVVYLSTEVVRMDDDKKILVVQVEEGVNKPYKDNRLVIWVKQGPDKRKVSDNAEIMRLFQRSKNLLADETLIADTSIEDIDKEQFVHYFQKEFGRPFEELGLDLAQALRAKKVLRDQRLTLAGLLFFGKDPQSIKPAFTIKAVSFVGNDIVGTQYRSKPRDLTGTIPELYEKAMTFLKSNLKYPQRGQGFNSIGKLEVSQIALEELLQNALIHRDYFKNAPIRLLIFDNRIEIISPGSLPNSLTVEEMKFGNPVIRNNQLVAFGIRTLPFSGLGSGVRRALSEQPDIAFYNNIEGQQFTATIPRPPEEAFSETKLEGG